MFKKFNKIKRVPDKKTDILIIDDYGYYWLKECLPPNSNHIVISFKSYPIILNIKFIFLFIKNFFQCKKNFFSLYITLIETLDPKVVITFQDNLNLMGMLEENFVGKLVISIQNGLRYNSNESLGGLIDYHHPIYYGFGDYERDLFATLNKKNISKKYIKAGSLRLGLFLAQNKNNLFKKNYDICLVSYFRVVKIKNYPKEIERLLEIQKQCFTCLISICSKNNYKMCVAMFSEKLSSGLRNDTNYEEEIDFYKNDCETKNIDFISNDFSKMGSYDTAFRSKIVIGLFSTLLIEMLGARKKILFGGLIDNMHTQTEQESFNHIPGNLLIYKIEENHIQQKIENLIKMPNKEYLAKIAFARDYYMRCERPYPHEMIKKRIADHLYNSFE